MSERQRTRFFIRKSFGPLAGSYDSQTGLSKDMIDSIARHREEKAKAEAAAREAARAAAKTSSQKIRREKRKSASSVLPPRDGNGKFRKADTGGHPESPMGEQ